MILLPELLPKPTIIHVRLASLRFLSNIRKHLYGTKCSQQALHRVLCGSVTIEAALFFPTSSRPSIRRLNISLHPIEPHFASFRLTPSLTCKSCSALPAYSLFCLTICCSWKNFPIYSICVQAQSEVFQIRFSSFCLRQSSPITQ